MVGVNKLGMIAVIASLGITSSSGVRAMEGEDSGPGYINKCSNSLEKNEKTLKSLSSFFLKSLDDLDADNKGNTELKEKLKKQYTERKEALEQEYAEKNAALEKEHAERMAALEKEYAKKKSLEIKKKHKHKKTRSKQSGEGG